MINKAILLGHVGQDPEIRTLGGKEMATFSLATTEKWKDRDTGERKERTTWHRIVVFSEPLVNVVKSYVKKGSKLYIDGTITNREWEDDSGVKRYLTEINIKQRGTLQIMDKRDSGGRNVPDEAYGDDQ
jgi:single-strand DNA-binding protein